jgi:hypothetical protein
VYRFEVVTPELDGVAARVAAAGSELEAATNALGRVAVAGPAADHPGVSAAIAQLAAAWGPAVNAMREGAAALGERAAQAGAAYEATDRGAMPGR